MRKGGEAVLRRSPWLAVIGLLLGAALVARGLPAGVRQRITPQRLLQTAVRLEAGAARTQAAAETPEARSVTLPSPSPSPAPEPTTTAEPRSDDVPTQTPDGLPILPTSFSGGLTIKNDAEKDVDAAALLAEGTALRFGEEGPQVLIVHTHTSEAYTPSEGCRYEASDNMRTQDVNYNIIRVGDVLAAKLEAAGLKVLHDRTVNDYPSYAGSYSRSGAVVEQLLAAYPTIRLVIDLHRDALASDTVVYKTVAELPDAQSCAQVMFVVGTDGLGLEHPNWQENLKLALYLQDAVCAAHPTLLRPIHLVKERYNQHLSPGMLLIEVGSSGNTLPEALRAAELFGEAAGAALFRLVDGVE